MSDEKHRYEPVPIPTYEEAIASSSRPHSSASYSPDQNARRGPEEISDDAERQNLLNSTFDLDDEDTQPARQGRQRRGSRSTNYHPPTVESARSSIDGLSSGRSSEDDSARGSTEALRRELEQMDVEDQTTSPSSLRGRLSRRLSSFKKRFSTIRIPFANRIHFPRINWNPRFTIPQCYYSGLDMEGQKCMIFLRLFALLLVLAIIYAIFVSDVFSFRKMNVGQIFEPESVRAFAQSKVNETTLMDSLQIVTRYPHIAGTEGNYVLAQLVESRFKDALMDEIKLEQFDVYLNYPKRDGRRIAIVEPENLVWEAKIDEEKAYRDREQTLVFHGHSKSGNVTGPLVYANYGSREDFAKLKEMGVKVEGSIALVKYYGTQGDRALKVKAAELAGAVGCIIYSDPAEDGFRRGPTFPEGRYRPADSVQRGGVSLMSWVVGDVLSPGWASTPSEKMRLSPGESAGLVQIPSMPLSWKDAQHLLKALQGHGKKAPEDWVGGVPDVEWWTGDDSKDAPKVNLMNIQDEVERQPIYNVIGKIKGIEEIEKQVIIGSHRDAWCFGAVDPGSGTAVLLEVVRVLGELREAGWRPLRSVTIASWDAEEYNLIGSTEHVEKHIDKLRKDGVVYINVDAAVSGKTLNVQANPVFKEALARTLNRLVDPTTGENLQDLWARENNGTFKGLGAGSDYVAFQDIAGISSIDLSFVGEPYPYHSCYDNLDWMLKFGDPGLRYHKLLAQIWVLLILEFSDSAVIPMDMPAYAAAIIRYIIDLEKYAADKHAANISWDALRTASKAFEKGARKTAEASRGYNDSLEQTGGFETSLMSARRRGHNALLAYFDTRLLDLDEGGGVSICQVFTISP